MRYHATVHDNEQDNARVFECHVIATDTGAARVTMPSRKNAAPVITQI